MNKRNDFRILVPLDHELRRVSGQVLFKSNESNNHINLSMGGFALDTPMTLDLEFETVYELVLFVETSQKNFPQTLRQQRESKSNKRQIILPFKLLREQRKSNTTKSVIGRFPPLSGVEGNRLLQFIQTHHHLKV